MDTQFLKGNKELQEMTSDSYVPHVDRVLRPEIVSSFSKPVKSDLKKQIPGLIKRSDLQSSKDVSEIEDMRDVLEVSQKIKSEVLPKIIRDLDDLKIVALSSK